MDDSISKQVSDIKLKEENNIDTNNNNDNPLYFSVVKCNGEIVDIQLHDGDARDVTDTSRYIPPHWNVDSYIEIVDISLKDGANVDVRDCLSCTPLHFSASIGDTKVAEILLKAGANIDAKNSDNDTPLHLSAENGHKEIVEILVNSGANVDAKNRYDNTPLHLSVANGYKEIVEILVKAGANVNSKNRYLNTPLHLRAENGHKEIVEVLLKAGANVDAINIYYSTPLHLSAKNGHKEIVEILLEAGANVDAINMYYRTPLQLSAMKGHIEIVEALLKAGAYVEKDDLREYPFLKHIQESLMNRSDAKSVGTLSRIRNWMYSVKNKETSVTSPTSTNKTISYTETTSVTFPALESQNLTCETNSSNKDQTDTARTSVSSLTPETSVGESGDTCSGSVPPTASSSERPCDPRDLDDVNNIRQQIQDHLSQFCPNYDDGFKSTCSADVKAVFQDGRIIMPTTIIINKSIVHTHNFYITDSSNIACQGPLIINYEKKMSLKDEYDDCSNISGREKS